jgi:large subunit ribosomal protein L20
MARVKGGVHAKKKHKSVLKRAKGYRGAASRRFRVAKEAVFHAERYAYRDRRRRKGDFRRLWITRINAASRIDGLSYSRFMHGLKLAEIDVDRKNLADLAVREPATFSALVALAKDALGMDVETPAPAPAAAAEAPAADDEAADATEADDPAEEAAADATEADDPAEEAAADATEADDPTDDQGEPAAAADGADPEAEDDVTDETDDVVASGDDGEEE